MLPQKIASCEALSALIEEIGFLPLFHSAVPGFSVEEMTRGLPWWSDDPESDPWLWRERIAAAGKIAYLKAFSGNAGFVARAWFPHFANARRDGYDFDTLYELGMAPSATKKVMDCLSGDAVRPTIALKRACETRGDFDRAVAFLQSRAYVVIRGTERPLRKDGVPYGWPHNMFSTAEALFGADFVRGQYDLLPARSAEALLRHAHAHIPDPADALPSLLVP